jgi:hypothetical protein
MTYNEYKELMIFTVLLLVNSGFYAIAVAAFLVVFSSETVWGHQQLDLPVCPSEDNGEVILFPKPENCSEFYQCADGYLFTHHCPDNLYYCPEKQYCAWFFELNCTFNCQIVKMKPASIDVTAVETAVPVCPPQVDGNLTLISNPDNCSSYYECDNGVPVEMDCPSTLYFCSEKSTCTWIWEPNCTFNCQILNIQPASIDVIAVETAVPVCPPQVDGNLTLLSNPNNCSSYYECDNGVPVVMDCPSSLYFCSEKSTCTWIWEPDCTFNCQILNRETAFVEDYHNDDTVPLKNHKIEVPGKMRRE